MPRKEQGWITFQSSEEERQILERFCQQSQRSKTEILRELVRTLQQPTLASRSRVGNLLANPAMVETELVNLSSENRPMKVSARNAMKGTIKHLEVGAVNSEVVVEIAPGVEVTSIITKTSGEQLGLAVGKEVYAVIKSSDVMIAVD